MSKCKCRDKVVTWKVEFEIISAAQRWLYSETFTSRVEADKFVEDCDKSRSMTAHVPVKVTRYKKS